MDGEESKEPGNRHSRLRGAFRKSVAWLKPKKGHRRTRSVDSSGQIPGAEISREVEVQNPSASAGEQRARYRASIEVPSSSLLAGGFQVHFNHGTTTAPIQEVPSSLNMRQQCHSCDSSGTSGPDHKQKQPQIPDIQQPSPSQPPPSPPRQQESAEHQNSPPSTPDIEMDEIEKLALQNIIRRKLAEGASSIDLGRFLVGNFFNADQPLGSLVTSLVNRQFAYPEITFAVLRVLDITVTDSMMSQLNQRDTSGTRFYARPAMTGSSSIANFGLDQGNSEGMVNESTSHRDLLRPVSDYSRPPVPPRHASVSRHARQLRYRSQVALPPLPPLPPPHGNAWRQRASAANADRRSSYIPSSNTPNVERSGEHGRRSVSLDDFDEPPILRPPTLERIHRGYYDEELDSVEHSSLSQHSGERYMARYR